MSQITLIAMLRFMNVSRSAFLLQEKSSLSVAAVALTALQASAACDNVICKCEKVTEAEVIAACHRALPIDSTQAIRKRTRAGMGNCQGKGAPPHP
jgi:NAD(P)H-nitrite reductase large subunit